MARGVAITLLLIFASGCATIFSGEKQDIRLRTYPPEAALVVDGGEQVPSGGVVSLSRDKQHQVDATLAGYEPKRMTIKQGFNPIFFVNLLWGPFFFVGMIVDAATGRINELEPTDATISLDPAGTRPSAVATQGTSSGIGLDAKAAGPSIDFDTSSKRPAASTSPAKPAAAEPTRPAAAPPTAPPAEATAKTARPKVARTLVGGAQTSWVLAVMNVESADKAGVDRETKSALTDQIRVFLAERGARVVDRSTQEAALKGLLEEEKKRSYAACVDSSCQVPLGKALAASHILRSTIARFGKACATNGELIDLKAEVTVAAGSAKSDCDEEALLWAAESLAEQLIAASAKR